MSVESAVSARPVGEPLARAAPQSRFFVTMSAVMLCVVLVGFAPTFYLRAFFDVRPVPMYVHVHGAALTGWFVWLLVQTALVAARRVDIHRRFGIFGVALGIAVLLVSPFVTLGAVRRLSGAYGLDSDLPFTVVGLSGSSIETVIGFVATVAWGNSAYLLAFAVFLTGAIIYRRRPEVHKRLMSLALISVIGPALTRISRWPVFGEFEDFRFGFTGLVLFLVALVAYDYVRTKRIHPVTLWGGAFCLVAIAGARTIAGTELGQALVRAIAVASAQETSARSAVGQIDHIMVRTGRPETLFTLFTGQFELPVAWPLATRGGVTSGGVGFGNVNVEAIQFPGQISDEPSLVGVAFEPPASLSESMAELDRRAIHYGSPRPFVVTTPDGSTATLWTNVTLASLSDSDRPADAKLHIFLSEYSPEYVDVEQRRVRLRRELSDGDGGPLGVERVAEVTIGTTDLEASEGVWAEVLAPRAAFTERLWEVGDGPGIRLVSAAENTLQGLVVEVRSLERAEGFLREKGLLGTVSSGAITLDASKVEGLRIRLVEEN